MSGIAIAGRAVGKSFLIDGVRRHNTLRDSLADMAGRLWPTGHRARAAKTPFWALRDLDFDVRTGEVLGIVGRNGAGKSTLLKLLSRITEPTTGEIRIRGRVGSLLEVGTGFHSELTGRENIFLNGAILGMGRAEITKKFDEIVDFADIEAFIDTPVKHYSSGMYLRLGFAVAAHLEPDILVIDEVLAVGDAEFQRKCLGKMSDVARSGRTVLFVSHNLDAIQRMCDSCMLLERGGIAAWGRPAEVVAKYLSDGARQASPGAMISLDGAPRTGSGRVRFTRASYSGGTEGGPVVSGGPLVIDLELEADTKRVVESLAVSVMMPDGRILVQGEAYDIGRTLRLSPGRTSLVFTIKALNLVPGQYMVSLWAAETLSTPYDYVDPAFELQVVDNFGSRAVAATHSHGLVPCEFTIDEVTLR